MSIGQRARSFVSPINRRLVRWGVDGRKAVRAAREVPTVRRERREYERQRSLSLHPEEFPIGRDLWIFGDRNESAGEASGHYFHQDLLVAREIFRRNPARHIDVGSSIYGFVSHVASFRDVEVIDIRPLPPADGITFIQQDILDSTKLIPECTDSLSCLHALEHFGLGRYGDSVNYDGWKVGLSNMTRMISPGGMLYLGVPTGEIQRVEFNAHRVFSLPFMRDYLTRDYDIENLAFVNDSGQLLASVDPYGAEANSSFGATYGCSIWVLRKR